MKTVLQVPPSADDHPLRLARLLERGVADGVITPEQSSALANMAAGPDVGVAPPPGPDADVGAPARGPFRSAVVAEVLGYLGSAVAAVSGLLIGAQLWSELAPWSRVGLLAVLTVVAAAAALALADHAGAIGRLASFLWAIAVVGVTATAGVAAGEFGDLVSEEASLLAFAVGTAAAVVVYAWRRTGLQQIVAFVGVVATASMALVDASLDDSVGLLIWAIGMAWLLATWGGYLRPEAVGYALGALAAVVGPFATGVVDERLSLAFGLLTAIVILVGAIRARRGVVIGIAVAAILAYLPQAFGAFFADMFAPMAVAFILGVLLLAGAIALARLLPKDGG